MAIPYDSSNPGEVLAALRDRYNDGQIPLADDLKAETPDGRVYSQTVSGGATSILASPGTWMRYTDHFRYPDGSYMTLPDGPYGSQGLGEPDDPVSTSTTTPLAASDGPYRRVTIDPSGTQYAGVKGQFSLPDSHHYYLNPAAPDDRLLLYFGSAAQGIDVDAGLAQQQPAMTNVHTNGWTAFIMLKFRGDKQEDKRFFPNVNFDFDGGQTVNVVYLARPSVQYPQWSKIGAVISVTDASGKVMTRYSTPAYKAGQISLRRVYSIAQGAPAHCRNTGSFFFGTGFLGGYAIQYGERNDPWDLGMTQDSQTGSYPAQGSLINWVEYTLYSRDDTININLQ